MLASSDIRNAAEARIGRVLKDKWRLERLIGCGGSGALYEAAHRNGSRVAIKVLHGHFLGSETGIRRFLREAYTANSVGHPGAVRIFDDDMDGGDAFLVMELLTGTTLADHSAARGPLPVDEVVDLADQLLEVLKAAHALGIVHRDIKPSNLFLEANGKLRVLDFGVARHRPSTLAASTTADGALVGTPAFMAPEQARARNQEVDARTDIWSFGATLFMLLSGEFVHVAGTSAEQLGLAMTSSARSLGLVCPNLPPGLVRIVDRCLRYEPRNRYQSADAVQLAIREFRSKGTAEGVAEESNASPDDSQSFTLSASETATKPAATAGRPWSSRASVALAGLGVAGALGVLIHLLMRDPNTSRHAHQAASEPTLLLPSEPLPSRPSASAEDTAAPAAVGIPFAAHTATPPAARSVSQTIRSRPPGQRPKRAAGDEKSSAGAPPARDEEEHELLNRRH